MLSNLVQGMTLGYPRSDVVLVRVYCITLIVPLTFNWPHLNSDVGLEEGEY